MNSKHLNRYTLSIVFPIGILFSYFMFLQMNVFDNNDHAEDELYYSEAKQKGGHIFGIKDSTDLQKIDQYNFDWITLVCWGYQDDFDSPMVTHHNSDSLQIKSYNLHWVQRIKMVREAGFKVFLKPHLWILNPSNGTWRSDIFPTNEDNWEIWQETYRNFILRYAEVAELGAAEMFCIGIEFTELAIKKPEYWIALIKDVRSIYSGKITYAANWYQEYEKVTFWDQLDYIGIQAYFPLSNQDNPSEKEINEGWKHHKKDLRATSEKYGRKILFTEMGYRSTYDGASKPWEWAEHSSNDETHYSPETQANCYKAFFKNIWDENWFAGVHIWQLRTDHLPKQNNLDFTPQGKAAEQIIAQAFE